MTRVWQFVVTADLPIKEIVNSLLILSAAYTSLNIPILAETMATTHAPA